MASAVKWYNTNRMRKKSRNNEDLPAKINRNDESPLQVRVRGPHVLLWTLAMVTPLVAITAVFLGRIEVETFEASTMNDEDQHTTLDKYNSYSGSIASIVSIPFQQLPVMLVPVFFLSFKAHAVLADRKSYVMEWGPLVAVSAISFSISLGLNSLNVQFVPSLEFKMLTTDLMALPTNTSNFTALNYITNTTHRAGVPSTDTILRSAIKPLMGKSKTTCTKLDNSTFSILNPNPKASIEFGFPLNSWLDSLLPESIASSKSFSFSMSDDFTNQQVDPAQFPCGNMHKTAMLLASAVFTTVELLTTDIFWLDTNYADSLIPSLEESLNSPDAASLLSNIQSTINSVSSIIAAADEESNISFSNLWDSIATSEVTIELSSFNLSSQVSFEAVTFDMPIIVEMNDIFLSFSEDNTTAISDRPCSDLGCIVSYFNSIQDQVRLLPLCAGETEWEVNMVSHPSSCDISNSSVLVFSLAQHLVMDEGVLDADTKNLTLNSPRTTLQVAVGRLSWSTKDLAAFYGSECAKGANCNGLHFALSDGKRHLVLGEEHIPVPDMSVYGDTSQWQVLVLANTMLTDFTRGVVVGYHLSDKSMAAYNESKLSGDQCTIRASNFINNIVERHIYSKDPVQPAYTAALFWLFQHAAVKPIESSNSTNVRLVLNGNRPLISVYASIPFASACITFVGCGLTLILGLLITWRSYDQQSQAALTSKIAAHNVISALSDANQFPPLLVSVGLRQQRKSVEPRTDPSTASDPIDRFEILQTTFTLRDRQAMTVRTVVIGSCSKSKPEDVTQTESSLVVNIKDTE